VAVTYFTVPNSGLLFSHYRPSKQLC